jgi:hypothetical protein
MPGVTIDRDAALQLLPPERNGGNLYWSSVTSVLSIQANKACRCCGLSYSGGVPRIKMHLLGRAVGTDVRQCTFVNADESIQSELIAKFALPEMRSALMLYFCEKYRTFVLSGCTAFASVPAEFPKWKDEVVVEKDLISEAFYAAYEIDALSTHPVQTQEILMHVRSMNPELKVNAEAIGGFMKR